MAKSSSSSSRRSSASAGKVITGDRVAGARAVVALNKVRGRPTADWVKTLAATPPDKIFRRRG